jgi:hypothetical protein
MLPGAGDCGALAEGHLASLAAPFLCTPQRVNLQSDGRSWETQDVCFLVFHPLVSLLLAVSPSCGCVTQLPPLAPLAPPQALQYRLDAGSYPGSIGTLTTYNVSWAAAGVQMKRPRLTSYSACRAGHEPAVWDPVALRDHR